LCALVVAAVTTLGAQAKYKTPRTPDGQPDLQGYWTNLTYTPFERPKELAGKPFYTEQEAIEAFKQLSALRPGDANAQNSLGEAYEAIARHDDSVEAFRQAIRLKPDFGKAYFNLGKTLLAQGNRDAAVEQYVILQNLDQDWAEKLYNLIYP
jgi:tetratricopeptide (TPR) repeat protein